jgi:chromosome segregation ATPase
MSEERLERIEKKQDTMLADIDTMKADIADLKTGQAEMRADIAGLKEGQDSLLAGQEDLGRQMRVLHEDAISRIKAIPEYSGPTKQEFERGLADIRETIGRRLDPLEATARRLSGS